MIQIWEKTDGGNTFVAQVENKQTAEEFVRKNNVENPEYVKVVE